MTTNVKGQGIISTEREALYVGLLQNWYADEVCATNCHGQLKACEVGFLNAYGGMPCQQHLAATQLVNIGLAA